MRAAPTVILDPGHGGKDPGGGSNDIFLEKDLALAISLRQAERLRQLGVRVALTRSDDVYLSPQERARIVRDSGAAYCISNHINAGGGNGAETIHSIHADGRLAWTIAAEIAEEGQHVRRVFSRKYPGDAKRDYYFMHRDTGAVETVIVEYGFADSPVDAAKLAAEWRRYAEAVVRAFCKHIGHPYTAPADGLAAMPGPQPGTEPDGASATDPTSAKTEPLPAVQRRIEIVAADGNALGAGFLIDGTAYAPVRLLAERLGAEASWDGERVVLRFREPGC